jgi:predicted amidophosphoribosyltransferase
VGLLDLLVPQRCTACGIEAPVLCGACRALVPTIRPPVCERCGAPTAWPVTRCSECAGRRLAFSRARAAVVYEGPAVAFVRAWKERGVRGAARLAAELVAAAIPAPREAVLTPVPAVWERELWRGHNPAAGLADALAAAWALPVERVLRRSGSRRPQRGLARAQRRRNVRDAFRAEAAPRRVVVVDDVYTSGATVAAAAAALRAAGAHEVEVLTFARTPRLRSGA